MKKAYLSIAVTVLVASFVSTAPASSATVVATVAGHEITLAEAEERVRSELVELDNARYDALRGGVDSIIADKLMELESEARGITVAELGEIEVRGKVEAPTEEQIKQVYEANKERIGDASLEDVRGDIVKFLQTQLTSIRANQFLSELREKYETVVLLDPPVTDVDSGGREGRGGDENAPVTIIAFSDYECPYCRAAEKVVGRVREKYRDKIHYVHRDFPLPFHANAHGAAEAARCAGAQGKFWGYHDGLFAGDSLSTESLQQLADTVGLDRAEFDECLSSGRFKEAVDEDLRAGQKVGVRGTPAFFINGRMLSGAQSFEAFERVIDEELARVERASK